MPNALIDQTSPYLLQHAHNPVDWQPWGDAAFAKARDENKLVFLSIGYSTCHWCHVMERESVENEAVARVMNHHFVNVKVDREERPDIDAVYMAFVQATTGQGGWPMSVWLTPEGKPVVGGTYFPPEDRHGRAGFTRICHELGRLWRDDRARLKENATKVMDHLRKESRLDANLRGLPGPKAFGDFIDRCESLFDNEWGGFGAAPKFPRPTVLRTLMQLAERFGMESEEGGAARAMCERTLRGMAAGGMHDHLAGGFHRYSVDRYWHIPHYEKMLYDQAQLAMAYLDAWQISGNDDFLEAASGIFRYLMADLRDENGAFHAAEDADSLPSAGSEEKREGAYWTWDAEEISKLLPPRDAAVFCAAYGVEAEGNARPESDPHGELQGTNTLFRAMTGEALASMFNTSTEEIQTLLASARSVLLESRAKRPMPHRDDKIVTAWNGLAIAALARGARITGRRDLADAARSAAEFLQRNLWNGGILYRSFRRHRGDVPAFPADYSFLICGLIELHGISEDSRWLEWVEELQQALDSEFWDAGQSGYVMRPHISGGELMTIREDYDGAEPSPNHMAAENLLKLATLLDSPGHAKRAEALLRAGSRILETHSYAAPLLLSALDLHERGVMKFQIPPDATGETLEKLGKSFLPRAVHTLVPGPAVTVCEGTVCRLFEP